MSLRIVCDACEKASCLPDRLKQCGWASARFSKPFGGTAPEVHLCEACVRLSLQLLKDHKENTKARKP